VGQNFRNSQRLRTTVVLKRQLLPMSRENLWVAAKIFVGLPFVFSRPNRGASPEEFLGNLFTR
jgi:hypothetical protein